MSDSKEFSFLKAASVYTPCAVKTNTRKSDCGLHQCFWETYQKQKFVEYSNVVEYIKKVIPSMLVCSTIKSVNAMLSKPISMSFSDFKHIALHCVNQDTS